MEPFHSFHIYSYFLFIYYLYLFLFFYLFYIYSYFTQQQQHSRREMVKARCLLLLIRCGQHAPLCRFSLWLKVSSWLRLAAWIVGPWQGRSTQGVLILD